MARGVYFTNIDRLIKILPRGSTLYFILRSEARSKMSKTLSVVCFTDIVISHHHITPWVADVMGLETNKDESELRVKGCGIDAAFDITQNLGLVLYGDAKAFKHVWL